MSAFLSEIAACCLLVLLDEVWACFLVAEACWLVEPAFLAGVDCFLESVDLLDLAVVDFLDPDFSDRLFERDFFSDLKISRYISAAAETNKAMIAMIPLGLPSKVETSFETAILPLI